MENTVPQETDEALDLVHASPQERALAKKLFFHHYKLMGSIKAAADAVKVKKKTAEQWVYVYRKNGKRVPAEKKRGRRRGEKRTLTPEQERKLLGILVDKKPWQYKFKFAMWNARAIRQLIKAEFGIDMPARTVRCYMQRNGWTAQRPEQRAREAKQECVKAWYNDIFPKIKQEAKEAGATIMWGDETGVCTRENYMRGYAPKGKTPIVEVTSNKGCRISMISAVSNQGKLMFHLYEGGLSVLKFVRFLNALLKDAGGKPVFFIVDNLRIHHAKIVSAWLDKPKRKGLLRLFFLPAYSPELNPDEFVNSDLKVAIGQREPAQNKKELHAPMEEHMTMRQSQPEKVKGVQVKNDLLRCLKFFKFYLPEQ